MGRRRFRRRRVNGCHAPGRVAVHRETQFVRLVGFRVLPGSSLII